MSDACTRDERGSLMSFGLLVAFAVPAVVLVAAILWPGDG